jgi:hypothetical protein
MSTAKHASQEWSHVLARIERLESQNSRLRKVIGITLLVFAAIAVMGQQSPKGSEVVAQSFVLKDAAGLVRARWETKGHAVIFRLFDTKEQPHLELLAADHGAIVTLGDATGRPRMMLGVQQQNGLDEASVSLCDKDGKSTVTLNVQPEYSGLKLSDPQGNVATGLLVTPHGTSLGFFGPSGNPGAQLGFAGGVPALLLYDQDGKLKWHTP